MRKLIANGRLEDMPRFLIARIFIVLIFLLVFYNGISALKTGEIRSRGHKFNRDEAPVGYWFTVLITLVGPVVIIYLMITR
jgi:hypothetical protein